MNITYIIVTALAFILVLGILVMVHELGHFLTARLFKVRVEEFGIGFPPRVYPSREVVRRRRESGKTVYSLNALPLGGFVRLAGENGVSTAPEPSSDGGEFSLSGAAAAEDDPGAFATKPAWQRALVLIAGPFNNMVLAMLLVLFMLAVIGTPHTEVEVVGVAKGSPAMNARIQPGDVIWSINGQKPQDASDVKSLILAHVGQRVSVQIRRGNQMQTVSLVPRAPSQYRCDEGSMGVLTSPLNPHYAPVPLGQAAGTALNVPLAVVQGILALPQQMGGGAPQSLCTPVTPYLTFGNHWTDAGSISNLLPSTKSTVLDDPCIATQSGGGLAGPIGIIRLVGCEANAVPTQGWLPLLTLMVQLSATLAIVNLLPIPALDGGRLLFVLISVVARRRVRPEVEGMAHALGMAALLTLMLVISWHDLANWLSQRPAF